MGKFIAITLFFISFIPGGAGAAEKSMAFAVTIFDKNIKVVSPQEYDPNINIILDNQTLSNIVGKLEVENSKDIKFVTIPAQTVRTFFIPFKEKDNIIFTPMAPAFQEVYFSIGSESFEIPPESPYAKAAIGSQVE